MTTNLKWRLSKLPSVDELRELVKDKIITQEEAREILFSFGIREDQDSQNLKEEIKFLRSVVESLSQKKVEKIVEVIKEVYSPWKEHSWYGPYSTWTRLNGTEGITTSAVTENFLDIKTF